MGKINKALHEQISRLPRLALRQVLTRKLSEQDVKLPANILEALLDHLISASDGVFEWNDEDSGAPEQNNDLQLVFDEADVRELDSFAERMRAALPGIIQSVIVKGADELLRALQRNWEAHYAIECVQIDDFEKRLDDCWGVGLNLLRLLLAIARGMGSDAERRFRRSKSDAHRYRRFALIRLHARACQVSDEIITLMQSGFADGAMARWRTIHEIGVVETLIEDGNEDLAKRYIDHNVVEVKKQADDWNDKQVSLGHAPIGRRQRQSIEKAYASAIGRYGQNFRHDYGWAAKYLGETRPDFKRLQMAADQSEMNTYYKLANFNVHAGARGMFFRLSDVGGANLQLAGRSNAGLLEPGRNTAYTLVRVTGTLLGQPRSVDRLVEIKTLITIRDAISPALERADRKLRNDEAKMRHDRKRRRKQ